MVDAFHGSTGLRTLAVMTAPIGKVEAAMVARANDAELQFAQVRGDPVEYRLIGIEVEEAGHRIKEEVIARSLALRASRGRDSRGRRGLAGLPLSARRSDT